MGSYLAWYSGHLFDVDFTLNFDSYFSGSNTKSWLVAVAHPLGIAQIPYYYGSSSSRINILWKNVIQKFHLTTLSGNGVLDTIYFNYAITGVVKITIRNSNGYVVSVKNFFPQGAYSVTVTSPQQFSINQGYQVTVEVTNNDSSFRTGNYIINIYNLKYVSGGWALTNISSPNGNTPSTGEASYSYQSCYFYPNGNSPDSSYNYWATT